METSEKGEALQMSTCMMVLDGLGSQADQTRTSAP
jgi:hypothetical protein